MSDDRASAAKFRWTVVRELGFGERKFHQECYDSAVDAKTEGVMFDKIP